MKDTALSFLTQGLDAESRERVIAAWHRLGEGEEKSLPVNLSIALLSAARAQSISMQEAVEKLKEAHELGKSSHLLALSKRSNALKHFSISIIICIVIGTLGWAYSWMHYKNILASTDNQGAVINTALLKFGVSQKMDTFPDGREILVIKGAKEANKLQSGDIGIILTDK